MLYPAAFPHAFGHLRVPGDHEIYWEESGNPNGRPVLVLHGGPGAPSGAVSRRWFDGRFCRIITFDQRGAGRSTPLASTIANTTQHLVQDIEALRRLLGVDRWILWGHSWGAALALAYAQRHGTTVAGLVLASPFTATLDEFDWIYRGGAAPVFPSQWSAFCRAVEDVRGDTVIDRYHRVLGGEDAERRALVASAWCAWEDCLAGIPPRSTRPSAGVALTRAVIGAHYERHRGFLRDRELLQGLQDIPPMPMHIVHGANDYLTPLQSSEEICARRPSARLTVVSEACHDPSYPALMKAIVEAGDAAVYEAWPGRKSA